MSSDRDRDHDIAIVGMSCRFPGAGDVEEFWRNLEEGVESVTFFDDEELLAFGVDPAHLAAPNFVRAAPVLEDDDRFDAAFFGYSPHEAALLDPQHRVFLETAWAALESAGYCPRGFDGMIGTFAGSSLSSYLLFNLLPNPEVAGPEDSFQLMIGNDKDFLCTRVAYHLGLRGPSVAVQTGCSTSLVATHLACESLISYQCDLALAGGVSVQVPQRRGYFHRAGDINSPDGHTRAFDAAGAGTVFGSGVGVVVLKRLAEAVEDGDTIYAVILGSALNNDGELKAGYTAPSVEGQAEVIARAQAVAQVAPESIAYLEAHGTATPLGDPVELLALEHAFEGVGARRSCGLGTVKSNIGHLDAAAGVAGLIKTALALHHEALPPSLLYERPNPKIDFDRGPFYVVSERKAWPRGEPPRRAGVSSFGIGGTNAHVVLEEAPAAEPGAAGRENKLLVLSARTEAALDAATDNLRRHLEARPELDLDDVAHTLAVGRERFSCRRTVLCRDRQEALARLGEGKVGVRSLYSEADGRPVAFLFPGGGAHHVDMARGLYDEEPLFREELDRCVEILTPHLGSDVRRILYPDGVADEALRQEMEKTRGGLPILFSVEHALARLWMSWGVKPEALIGHSLGEYVAACLAGVVSLEDALGMVLTRGSLMEQLPPGRMLSLHLPVEEVREMIGDLSIAAVNGPSQCVVSGPEEAIEQLAERFTAEGIEHRRVHVAVAAHSAMMEEILDPFRRFVETLDLRPPEIPFVSNVTGTWIRPGEATDPGYWARHLRHTVRFGDGISTLSKELDPILLEVGPGRTLATLARAALDREQARAVFNSLPHPLDPLPDRAHLLDTLGQLWLAGAAVDWRGFQGGRRSRRVPLPTYPFERRRHWIDPPAGQAARRSAAKTPVIENWFYHPSWHRAAPGLPAPAAGDGSFLLFGEGELADELARILRATGRTVTTVARGRRFERLGDRAFRIDPLAGDGYRALLRELSADGLPDRLIHLWGVEGEAAGDDDFATWQARGLYSLLHLTRALGEFESASGTERQLCLVADRLFAVEGSDRPRPAKATLQAPALVIPQEKPHLRTRLIEVDGAVTAAQLADELVGGDDPVVARRGSARWLPAFEPTPLPAMPDGAAPFPLRQGGTYLLTGGLGGVGLLVGRWLAETFGARLVLVGRTAVPSRESWPRILSESEEGDPLRRRIEALAALEEAGAEVLTPVADVTRRAELAEALARTRQRFGPVHGIFHLAGQAGTETVKLIDEMRPEDCADQLAAKVEGTAHLAALVEDLPAAERPDFVALFSSNASVLGGLGSLAYSAANLYLDAFATVREGQTGPRWLSLAWDGWLLTREGTLAAGLSTSLDRHAMAPEESVEALRRVLTRAPGPRVVISTGDLEARRTELDGARRAADDTPVSTRPTLGNEYMPPENEVEAAVARVWQELLGIDEIGVEDNFFDLGGNSLIGLKVISALKAELGIDIAITKLFEGPTVRALARVVAHTDAEASFAESESRGERRRAARKRRRGIQPPAGAESTQPYDRQGIPA